MQAIIMAAGKGSRLGNLTEDKPKAFIEVQGIKLIEYNIALLHFYGIKDIIIVTGYKNEQYEKLAEKIDGIKCIYNPFYEMMNVLGSFFMGQEYLREEDTIYMHADTLCAPEIFDDMINKVGDMVLPVDYKECDEEAMKVRSENGKLIELSKNIPNDLAEGEFIGIAKLSKEIIAPVKQATKILTQRKEFMSYFEGAIQYLIDQKKYNIETIPTKNRFWGEIDFIEDYEKVKREISPELVRIAKEEFGQ